MKKTEDLTDREIQEGIYRNLKEIRHITRSYKSLIYLIGFLVIVWLVLTLRSVIS